mmetsp:Transcript_4799/g.11718  ORF Transcript_4799/g.11718 Transcript_4799/m.11718 type:complete len:260 (+) Transcript_4799:113-892(+)
MMFFAGAVVSVVSSPPPLLHCVPIAPPPQGPLLDSEHELSANLVYTFVSLLFFAPMGAFIAGTLFLCYRGWLEDQKERRRISNFMGVTQFYEYEPRKIVLLSEAVLKTVYDEKTLEVDSAGEPLALTGERLYPHHVSNGAPSPPPAQNALGGGRLQRLWLMRGAGSSGRDPRAAERRLQRTAAERAERSQCNSSLAPPPGTSSRVLKKTLSTQQTKQGRYQKLKENMPAPPTCSDSTELATATRGHNMATDGAGALQTS